MTKAFTINIIFLFLVAVSSQSQTTVNSGSTSGKWTKSQSPYYIKGNISIPKDSTLTIESGVQVRFDGKYNIAVYGKIKAIGKIGDTIRFYPQDTLNRWRGIRYFGTKQTKDSAIFSYCKFEYAGPKLTKRESALYLTRGHFNVNHCVFKFNNGFQSSNSLLGDSLLSFNLSDCYFYKNNSVNTDPTFNASSTGSVVAISNGKVTNCIFQENIIKNSFWDQDDYADFGSEGTLSISDFIEKNMNITILGCKFIKNITGAHSAAISPYLRNNGKVLIKNCEFTSNFTGRYGCISFMGDNSYNKANFKITIDGCLFSKNRSACTYIGPGDAAAINLTRFSSYDSVIVRNNIFEKNIAGATISLAGRPGDKNFFVMNNIFRNNYSSCLMSLVTSEIFSINNIYYNNLRGNEIAFKTIPYQFYSINDIYAYNGIKVDTLWLDKQYMFTVSGSYYQLNSGCNNTYSNGGVFRNCIFWNNINGRGNIEHLRTEDNKIQEISNCILNGNLDSTLVWATQNNISRPSSLVISKQNVFTNNPLFINPPVDYGPDANTTGVDFHLLNTCSSTSPAYNAGIDSAYGNLNNIGDFEGNPRIKCNIVDIGPYELEAKRKLAEISSEPIDKSGCFGSIYTLSASSDCGMNLQYRWQKKNGANSWNNIIGANQLTYSSTLQDSGLYRLIVKQPDCLVEDTSRVVKVSQYPSPKPYLGKDTIIKNNQSLTLDAGNGNSFLWQNSSTNKTFVINGSTTTLGKQKYSVTVTNQYSCKGSDTIEVTVVKDNALNALTTLGWKVYPNPSSGIINIHSPDNGNYAWDIVDVFGRLIDKGNSISETKIDIGNLPNGPYFIHIFYNNSNQVLKIIKE